MTISFVPRRGQILICDLVFGQVPPEIGKRRRVLIVSPRSYNQRHGKGPGRCLVVPFSTTAPVKRTPAHVPFSVGRYVSLTRNSLALCDCVRSVSHARLDRVFARGIYQSEMISGDDMGRIETGIRHAMGLA
jgi:mRNA-degrading endonuclease toxin of MazEF toxin-antitoxin module